MLLLSLLIAFSISWGVNRALAHNLIKPLVILAQVNRRSAHTIPVPLGGGIGILLGIVLSLPFLNESHSNIIISLYLSCIALGILSWWNDKVDLRASLRLGIQTIAACYCVFLLLPFVPWQLFPFLVFALLWFTNLYNFMDGSDGILAVETIAISLGLAILSHSLLPLTLTAATLAFLCFNWPPAKLFSGDVGSIPIGFLLGFLLLLFAINYSIIPAFILPLYFTMDATITLCKRILRREKIWQAHAQHYYQQAIQKGFSHRRVMLTVAALNGFLIFCAYVSMSYPVPAIFVAVLAVMLCLWHFRKPA